MPLEFEHLIRDVPPHLDTSPMPQARRIITTWLDLKARVSIDPSIFTGENLDTATAQAKARNEANIKAAIFSDLRKKVCVLIGDVETSPIGFAGDLHLVQTLRAKLGDLLNSIP